TDTDHRADFGGLLSDVTASLGALVSPNERLGLLIDPTALEAVFRVTNAQYARLLDDRGALRPIRLVVTLDLDDRPLRLPGVIERASAVIGEGETGRQIYARLELEAGSVLRPGDFVAVEIEEPALTDVATLPAAAVTEAGQLLVLDETDRLRSADVRILRRQGDEVIVADAPEGVRYVASRAPQLGAGVKVRPLGEVEEGQDLVDLAPDRQKRLIGFVERSDQMSSEMKVRMLSTLRSGRAPADMVDRIERRMGSAG
ncbi:MAG: HlyD family efflux transporter periplasmic adaptor subunit, partial [Pseudomonadota bacterium]